MIRSATLFNTARPVAFPAPFISPLVPGLGRRFSPVELRLNLSSVELRLNLSRPVVLGNYAGHNYSGLTEDAGESSTRFWVLGPRLGDHLGKKGALGSLGSLRFPLLLELPGPGQFSTWGIRQGPGFPSGSHVCLF